MSRLSALLAQSRPLIMGIVNVTPDSFSDGGDFLAADDAVAHARRLLSEGADILDIGGESTRPGADAVTPEEELSRVLPVLEALADSSAALSIDTSTPAVIEAALALGVDLINDVRALRRPGAIEVAAGSESVHICLMHMQGDPATMQMDPRYDDLVGDINTFFADRIADCEAHGINRERIILDPGFGFGKLPSHNLTLVNRLAAFSEHGCPLLVGLSRKSTIGRITDDRVTGSVAGALAALQNGASIIRVHDVAQTVAAVNVMNAIRTESGAYDG